MSAIAKYHYPQIAWRGGEKWLWNPIHKKLLKNRPEERVRLRIIEALVEAGWSKHRISTEEQLRPTHTPGGRTDIICYDRDFNPQILVECKAESVPITAGVAEQTARYNRTVDAPYLLMTNGLADYWYYLGAGEKPERIDSIPDLLSVDDHPREQEFNYWKERGFAGTEATDADLRKWLVKVFNTFWKETSGQIRYIEFNNSPTDLTLNHYFHISNTNSHRVALSVLATPYGGTRMIGVINKDEENVGLIEINLDLVASDTTPNATIYSADGPRNFDVRDHIPLKLKKADTTVIHNIPGLISSTFDQLAGTGASSEQ